jgi:hypothetical protein
MRDPCSSVDIAGQQVVFHAKLLLRRAVNEFRSAQAPPILRFGAGLEETVIARIALVERLVATDGADAVGGPAPLTSTRIGARIGEAPVMIELGAIRHETAT